MVSNEVKLKRRSLLLCALTFVACAALPGRRSYENVIELSRLFARAFGESAAAKRIGTDLLAADSFHLDDLRLMFQDLTGGFLSTDFTIAEMLRISPEGLRRILLERIDSDYLAGRVTYLNGWMISETEAKACALVAIG